MSTKLSAKILAMIFSLSLLLTFTPIAAFADADDPVAKIGDTTYTSLQAALEAASADDTIIMIADSTEDAADISIDKRLTIDLAGHTITVPGLITISKNLKIKDSSDNKSGKFSFPDGDSTSYAFDIKSGAELELQSGTISSAARTAANMSGGLKSGSPPAFAATIICLEYFVNIADLFES